MIAQRFQHKQYSRQNNDKNEEENRVNVDQVPLYPALGSNRH